MDINELNEAQDMLAENETAVLEDFLAWMEQSDAALVGLLQRLPTRLVSDASMLINRMRGAIAMPRSTDVPLLLNRYQPPVDSNSTSGPQPIAPNTNPDTHP